MLIAYFLQGAFVHDDQMIDKPSVLQAENIQRLANLIDNEHKIDRKRKRKGH